MKTFVDVKEDLLEEETEKKCKCVKPLCSTNYTKDGICLDGCCDKSRCCERASKAAPSCRLG